MALFTIRVEIHPPADLDRLARIEAQLDAIRTAQETLMAAIDDLTTQVAETKGVMQSATVLLQGIIDRLDQAGTDPQKLADLRSELQASTNDLSAAVAAVPPKP